MEHWWNDSDGGKQKYSDTNLSQSHLVHHKSNTNRPDIYRTSLAIKQDRKCTGNVKSWRVRIPALLNARINPAIFLE